MQMRLQLSERHPFIDGRRVTHHMQVAVGEVDDAMSRFICDVATANIPFFRNVPVERLRSRLHLVNSELRYELLQVSECFADTVPREDAVYGKQVCSPLMHLSPDRVGHAALPLACRFSKSSMVKRRPSSSNFG